LNDYLSLQELPTSIGQLITLQEFNLSMCYNLQELPTSIGQLNAEFQKLHLNDCSSLQELVTSIGQLNALQKLDLGVFEVVIIIYIFWPIECTLEASFVE
jgi:hypothetical protein